MSQAAVQAGLPSVLRGVIGAAPTRARAALVNSGWVRHTLESAAWGLLATGSFEEAVVQVVNLGSDADTAGTVVGALAGAAYGLEAIPAPWREAVHANGRSVTAPAGMPPVWPRSILLTRPGSSS